MGLFTATKADYAGLLKRLSPPGKLFGRLSAGFAALYDAIGAGKARLHNRLNSVLDAAHPADCTEAVLDQWLAAYGLPEPGMTLPSSIDERRALLLSKMTTDRGQSPSRMIAIAEACGCSSATVTEWFDTGRPHTWRMNLGSDVIRFRCGTGKCGDKLRSFTGAGNAAQQQILRAKPAHTIVEFTDL